MENCSGMVYYIKSGDTLYSISRRYNMPLALILRANPFVDIYNLQIGDAICIPVRPGTGMSTGMGNRPWDNAGNHMVNRPGNEMMNGTMDGMTNTNMDETNGTMDEMNGTMDGTMGGMDDTINDTGMMVTTYMVSPNESMEDILNRNNISLEEFIRYNNLNNLYLIPGSPVQLPK